MVKFPLNFEKFIYSLPTYIYTSLKQYLSVADNAGDAVLLHVSASSERQEFGNKSGLKKGTKYEIYKKLYIDMKSIYHFVL
jgi:hypothetical protein